MGPPTLVGAPARWHDPAVPAHDPHPSSRRTQRGQSAAEYLGVVIVVVAVIAALSQSGIGNEIAGFLKDTIGDISGT